jgi:predicted nucleic acid-binding protein
MSALRGESGEPALPRHLLHHLLGRGLEPVPREGRSTRPRTSRGSDGRAPHLTSRLSRLECRVKPLRDADTKLLADYEAFFTARRLVTAELHADVIEQATELRAKYGFKTPDALHLATAVVAQADVFLTGDAALAKCSEVKVEIVT